MSSSVLAGLYARTELFRQGQHVYLRKPGEESDGDVRNALTNLRGKIGSGPFQVLRVVDTPSSKNAPQRIVLAELGSNTSLQTGGGPMVISGYYLSTDPQ